jgi:hypothetical protein
MAKKYENVEKILGLLEDEQLGGLQKRLSSTERSLSDILKKLSVLENESDPDDEANISKIIECYDSLIVLYADKGDSKTGMEQGRMAFEYAEKLSSEFAKDSAMAVMASAIEMAENSSRIISWMVLIRFPIEYYLPY